LKVRSRDTECYPAAKPSRFSRFLYQQHELARRESRSHWIRGLKTVEGYSEKSEAAPYGWRIARWRLHSSAEPDATPAEPDLPVVYLTEKRPRTCYKKLRREDSNLQHPARSGRRGKTEKCSFSVRAIVPFNAFCDPETEPWRNQCRSASLAWQLRLVPALEDAVRRAPSRAARK
jgi:hypothetical protein